MIKTSSLQNFDAFYMKRSLINFKLFQRGFRPLVLIEISLTVPLWTRPKTALHTWKCYKRKYLYRIVHK